MLQQIIILIIIIKNPGKLGTMTFENTKALISLEVTSNDTYNPDPENNAHSTITFRALVASN